MADELKASPQEPITGALAKALGWMAHPTVDGHEIKPHLNLPSLLLPLESGAKFFENRSYGKPYTTGAGGLGGTQNLAPDVRDFAMDVAPYAPDVARLAGKGAKAIGKGVGEAMSQFAPSGSGPKTLTSQVGAIKPKGGNWLTGNVEKSLEGLKSDTSKGTPAQMVEFIERKLKDPNISEDGKNLLRQQLPQYQKESAINNWVDKNLTNYVKKEMGTPEDPVRKLAEEGILHSPMEAGRYRVPENIKQARFNAGFPTEGMGQSDLAKAWEHLSDASIKPYQVRGLLNAQNSTNRIPKVDQIFEQNPWLSKLNPEEVVHETRHPFGNLGFDHIIDVLKEDVASGRLHHDNLKNVSMEQAVRRTHEYDQEMAKKVAEARAKNLEGMTVYKEYPEGYKWVQLDKPGQFSAESDAMGHSVRGYEPPKGHPDWIPESGDSGSLGYGHGGWEAIKNKEAKVYSLVDPKGNPHTTVEVKANQNPYPVSGEAFAMLPQSTKAQYGQYVREWRQRNPHIEDLTDEYTTQALKEAGVPPQPDSITQIKGKSNAKPVDTYIPYVQDFVKSGNWGDVGDLHNTGLTSVNLEDAKELLKQGIKLPRFIDNAEDEAVREHITNNYTSELKNQNHEPLPVPESLLKYKTQPEPTPEVPSEVPPIAPPETPQFKRGGKVHITDNLDTQWAETAFKPHMAVGGGEIANLVEKAIEKAIKIPTKFERATPLTKEAIDAMAERMAPQVTGEFVRAKPTASQPNPSKSVTGKSQKQFESEKNLGLVTRDIKPPVKPSEFDYTDPKNKGKVLIGTSGDVTPTNKEILEIKGVPIEPTEQQGGAEYGLYNPAIYAASNDQAQAYQAQAKRASEAYGDAEPLLHYHRMTDDANWYAMHHLQTLLNYMKPEELAKIDPSKYGQLVKLIQEKDVGFGLHPQFGGFEDPLSINLHAQIDPDFRRHVGKILQMPSISQNFGLRSGLDVLAATSEPELRNLEAGAGGFAIAPIDIKTPYTPYTSPNRTYETDILGGEVKRSKYPVPYQLAYPDATQFLIENPPEKGANNVFGRLNFTKPRQIIDQQFQDEVGQYMDKMKELTGKKDGGEVHMAGGGLVKSTAEMMEHIMAKLGQKSIQNTSKIIPKETNYVTKQDGPFYRVTPKSISTSTSSNSGARQKIWGSDATNDTTTRREFGSRDTPLFSHEGLQEVINNNAENLPRNLANKKTQEIYGKDYQELAMPDSSLVKQAPIARAFMSGANNEEGYKNAIFNAYLEQHPELIEQTGSKNYDDLLKASYEQLAKETKDQFKSLPFNFSFHQGEGTYPNSASMNADVHGNNHIYVFQGGDKHDFLNEVDPETGLNTNEMFRAVHDIFGHGIHGNQFGPKGEEIAWGAHHQMYSPLAIPAMTAETRGQNSVVNYSPLNADIKSAVSALENRIIDAKRERNFEQAEKLTATKADLLTNQFRYAPQASVLLPPEMLKPEYSGGMPDYLKDVIKPDPETKYATSLYHFSHDPNLSLTNPEKYGTGIKGQEAERLEYSNAIKPRTYFYTDENVKPEVGLGSNRYKTQAEDLYNLQADPLNFFTLAKEANRQPFTAKYNAGVTPSPQSIANDVERLAKEYGYSGVVNPSLSKPAAAVFKPMDVEPYKIGGEVHLAGGGSASKALESMLAEAPELANTIRGLFKAEAPTLGSLVDKLRTPDRQSVLPMPNRWFLDPENHPEVQGLVQKVLDVNGMNRSDFHSGAYVDPKTGKIIDTQIHKDVGVAIDPITNKPVMTTGGLTGMESLPKDQGSFTNSNLLKQGKYKPVGGDSILNDLGFIATVDKAGMGHAYGLGTDYASPVLLNNLGTGSNPTLRPRSVGDVFGIGDVVGQMQINKNSPVHDVYEKLLVAPKGSDVQGVKLSKKKGGKVQITNNPDTQWAELQFQRK